MVKFVIHKGDRVLVGLGLSRLNTVRLLEGKPIGIQVDGPLPAGMGLITHPAIDILIVGGETEEAIAAELREQGLGQLEQ